RIRWVTGLPARIDPEEPDSRPIDWVGPVLASGRLLVASSEGELVTVSPETGERLGSLEIGGGGVSVAPAIADGTVFFLTDNATLVAVR
ncbi:MAG: PQQ-binding-like beta-propeller repeat protein, partial [Geminicoccaceae bacterium]